jgi:hypothetical protein
MTEETKGDLITKLLNRHCRVMKENEEFLRSNAPEAYKEVIELAGRDVIQYTSERRYSGEEYVKRSMVFFLFNVLMPLSYAIHTDLLIGNLPACFMELRLMLESLVKCYLADVKYPEKSFRRKLELLEKETKERDGKKTPKREHDFMEEFDNMVNLDRGAVKLWGKLSKDWVHTRGIIDRVVSQIIEKSIPPSWALIIPFNYTEADLDDIRELGKRVSQFREILKATVEKRRQNLTLESS